MASFTWLLWTTPAFAHTDLITTRPGDGEVLMDPVVRIELEFSGALDAEETSVRLLNGNGGAIPVMTTHVSEVLVVVEPDGDVDGGRYAVMWSVRSASDAHEASGSFHFDVGAAGSAIDSGADGALSGPSGEPSQSAGPTISTPPISASIAFDDVMAPDDGEGAASEIFERLGRWIAMTGAIIGVGAIGFAATSLVGTPAEVRRAAWWIRSGGILILVGSAVELTAAATTHGHSLVASVMPWTWIDVLPASQAYAMVLRIAGAIAMLQSPRLVLTSPGTPISDPFGVQDLAESDGADRATVATAARTHATGNRMEIQHEWMTVAGTVMVIVSFGLDGHTADAGLIGRLASMVHVLAAGIWAGGLVVMADLLIRRRRSSKPPRAAAVIVRFSRVASAALVLAAIAGGILAWSLIDDPAALWSGAWGRTLVVKLALVAAAAGIGGYNRFRVVPHLDEPGNQAAHMLRRTVAVEALLVLAVLAVTAVLVTAAP